MLLKVFYEQFKFFINLYFLAVALTQFIPELRIGYLYTYWAPLVRLLLSGMLWVWLWVWPTTQGEMIM